MIKLKKTFKGMEMLKLQELQRVGFVYGSRSSSGPAMPKLQELQEMLKYQQLEKDWIC